MFGFFQAIFEKFAIAVAGLVAAVGLAAPSTSFERPTPEPTTTPTSVVSTTTATTTLEEIDTDITLSELEKIHEELERERAARLRLERKIDATTSSNDKNISETPKSEVVDTSKDTGIPNTFTTPNGAVIDEAGNVISGPTKTGVSATTNITAGAKVLTGEEIYSVVSPSVVLVESSDGHGTGFVIEGGKYTLTNAHVVNSDSEVTLTFYDGTKIKAPVLGSNISNDVALIFNNNIDVKPVLFGSSDNSSLKTGSEVYALGYPRILTNTITFTRGIVSANRQEIGSYSYIQTDVTIHGGNSGGPLVNNRGEVVGVNTLGIGDGGGGLEFAIPIENIKAWIPSLSQYGQSRYEKFPIGSSFTIKKSVETHMEINLHLTCEQMFKFGEIDLEICDLYKTHKDDYTWIIEDDTTQ